ncbi:MAG: peptidylprolyl isomerase, partial [Pelagibacterales bacterium]|nr:peptidylprolyl isomerase [Pelagibacterales bacterium]
MFKKLFIILTLFLFSFSTNIKSKERSIMIMKLKTGEVKIELFDEIAPNHVKRIKALADSG